MGRAQKRKRHQTKKLKVCPRTYIISRFFMKSLKELKQGRKRLDDRGPGISRKLARKEQLQTKKNGEGGKGPETPTRR